jgi:hypothetical protein
VKRSTNLFTAITMLAAFFFGMISIGPGFAAEAEQEKASTHKEVVIDVDKDTCQLPGPKELKRLERGARRALCEKVPSRCASGDPLIVGRLSGVCGDSAVVWANQNPVPIGYFIVNKGICSVQVDIAGQPPDTIQIPSRTGRVLQGHPGATQVTITCSPNVRNGDCCVAYGILW